ncbi:MAG: xanthine dehydrogenase family protein subunit M [Burkholderiaceae bacterium]|jgi:xanthine dehydrogenase YagS FAD-binding subunit
MRPFTYERAESVAQVARLALATGQGGIDAPVQFLAGGTTLVDLMKQDVLHPRRLVDINPLAEKLGFIRVEKGGLRLGAMAKMSAVADHPTVRSDYPVIAQSLNLAASAQLRNMATLGGNVLQRTRCAYFRDPSWRQCNKRVPGSGCAALEGVNRDHAILGIDGSCIAKYPGDFGVALAALDAEVEVVGPEGRRRFPFLELHRKPGGRPNVETTLRAGELITEFFIPAGALSRNSLYLKVRDRTSYEFALASAAVALELDQGRVLAARIGIGGAAYRPWRSHDAESVLVGEPLTSATIAAAAETAVHGAITHGDNDFKPELVARTVARALTELQQSARRGEGI